MSENEIKPVDRMVQQLRNDGFDDAADYIDRLTAERDAAVAQRDGYMEQHRRDSQELRSLCAQRDEAQRKLSVAVAEGKGFVADADRLNWLDQQMNEGCAPAIVNDDDGRWAYCDSGTSPVPEEGGHKELVAITAFAEPHAWRPSIREAIDAARAEGGV